MLYRIRPITTHSLLAARGATVSYRERSSIAVKPIKKVLIANRGEIAIRVARACRELDIASVSIFAHEDRFSLHRSKTDESYLIGAGKEPVAAYLDVEGIVNTAVRNNVDAVHPGYGFLSERSDFAKAVVDAGMRFIGPTPEVMARMGDKVAARQSAIQAGVPVIPGTDTAITTVEEAVQFANEFGTPIILKAAFGGGGRGMRRVDDLRQVAEAFTIASREAAANFGNGSMFVERFITKPRHIEVQLMGDHHGNIVHLFERDCSVQRRHQKVVEIAPATHLDPQVRQRILDDALKIARHVGYENAGTVEFLLDQTGKHYFIEVNARLQVEHTVTEEVTGVDLVQTQIKVAEGAALPDIGITQEGIKLQGSAIQCRLTTEDPVKGFQPDSGRMEVYRTGEGMGIRLDGTAYPGAVITPFYDSLLTKIIAKGATHEDAAKKLTRALLETRIRGVKTNKHFVLNVLENPDFVKGFVDTSFIDENPELLEVKQSQNRGHRLVKYFAETAVNGPTTKLGTDLQPARNTVPVPTISEDAKTPAGWRDILVKEGPKEFAKAIRQHKGLLLTDTTYRDAHQSLLATRLRTHDMLRISPFVSHSMPQLLSMENWGGATFDASMQFLRECPWDRLQRLREAVPNIPFQCLLRGANAMGYSNFPDNVIDEFCRLSVNAGMDIFRVFDCLNYVPNILVGVESINKAGGVVEATISYTGDVMDKTREKYNLDYYLDLAEQLVKHDIHILGIKDMAGVLKPGAAKLLIGELRRRYPNLPIHLHSHDTAGVAVASIIAAAEAGVDVVDCAVDAMSGMTSQASMGAIVNSLRGTDLDTGIEQKSMSQYNTYWEQTRRLYAPFECTTTMRSGNSDVFRHEIPGGQYTNLQFQSVALNLADKFDRVCENYREANLALGDIIKVTPSSKVTGDLSQVMTQQGINTAEELLEKADDITFPASVNDFFEGKLGQPPYGFPEKLRQKVLRGKKPIEGRPGASMPPLDLNKVKSDLETKHSKTFSEYDVMSSIMFPNEFSQMTTFRDTYGPVDRLPTDVYFVGPEPLKEYSVEFDKGKTLLVKLISVGNVNANGDREVHFEVNGQGRSVFVRDKEASKGTEVRRKAMSSDNSHVGAPMVGTVLEVKVKVGDKVKAKQPLCVLSAMKMQMAIEAKVDGVVAEVVTKAGDSVNADDLLIVVKSN